MGGVVAHTDLAAELAGTIGRFRRQLRQSAPHGSARLPESHAELLRLVARRPGISVSAAAAELGLRPNSASTLVSRLVGDGLLARTIDAVDRRVCRLWLTESAEQLIEASAAARRALVAEVLDELDDEQIAALAKGLEVLTRMTQRLQERHT